MQLTASRLALGSLVVVALSSSGSSSAQEDGGAAVEDPAGIGDAGVEAPEQHWYDGLRIANQATYFRQFDHGGIEQIEEDGWVVEDLILIDAPVSDHDRVSLRLLGDVITSATIDRQHNQSFRSLQSEASVMFHLDGRLGWRHESDGWDLGAWGGGSWDYLYSAGGFGIDGAVHLLERNTSLGLSVDGYLANLKMIRFNGQEEADRARRTVSQTLYWTQLLTALTVLHAAVGYTYQSGFLASQLGSVFVDGIEQAEILPETRHRGSGTLRLKQGLGQDHSIELGCRYYHDTWGIDAGTGLAGYSVYLAQRRLLLDLGYRYYEQSAADSWASGFPADPARSYQTSDPDLGPFMGHMGTVRVTLLERLLGDGVGNVSLEAAYYHRTNGLEMIWFSLGYRLEL